MPHVLDIHLQIQSHGGTPGSPPYSAVYVPPRVVVKSNPTWQRGIALGGGKRLQRRLSNSAVRGWLFGPHQVPAPPETPLPASDVVSPAGCRGALVNRHLFFGGSSRGRARRDLAELGHEEADRVVAWRSIRIKALHQLCLCSSETEDRHARITEPESSGLRQKLKAACSTQANAE